MSRLFNADEVFQIAMELEETGQVFYEALAIGAGKEPVSALCRRLAADEARHYARFKWLRAALPAGGPRGVLSGEEADFAQALINDRVIPNPEQARKVAARGSLREALDLAVAMEKDSVLFYEEIILVVAPAEAEGVEQIVREEKRHVAELTLTRRDLR